MSVSWNTILRESVLRVNGLTGPLAASLETAYTTVPLTTTQMRSADFSFSFYKDTCLAVEGKLANAIANVGNHPWRAYLTGVTSSLAHKASLPSLSSASKPIIGIFGSVYDASDGTVCTENSLERITRRTRNAGSRLKSAVYWYKMDGQRIYHTRTNVVIDVCVYDRSTQLTSIGTLTNNILLPDVLEEAYVCGMVSYMVRDDAFVAQSQIYRQYFNDTLAGISQGLTSVPSKVQPGPSLSVAA